MKLVFRMFSEGA